MDGDGDVDVVSANKNEANRIHLNDGSGNFSNGPTFGTPKKSIAIAIDDIDADFDLDVVIGNDGRAEHRLDQRRDRQPRRLRSGARG